MDDDKEKSIFESFADAIQNTFDKAVDVTKNAIEPERIKPGDQVVIMPMAGSSMSDPMMPPFVIIPGVRKQLVSKQQKPLIRNQPRSLQRNPLLRNQRRPPSGHPPRKPNLQPDGRLSAGKRPLRRLRRKRRLNGKDGR